MQRRPHTSPAFGEERGQEEGYRVTHEAMKEPPDSGRSTYRSVGGPMDIGHESLDQLEKEYNSGIDIHADHTAGQVFQQIVDDHHHFIRSDHGSDDTSDELLSGPSTDQVMKQPHKGSESADGLSREELGRLIASRWTGEHSMKETNEPDDAKEEEHEQEEQNQDSSDTVEEESYDSDVDDDRHKFDDDDFEDEPDEEYGEDHVEPDGSYDPDKDYKSDSVRSMRIMASWFLSSAEASRIKKEYNDANSKLSKLRSRISSLTEKLKHDFGKYTT
ncbi:hypothetical protein GW17_00013307 [Ensete ventricosum]|nr:hypothetical protein GW17_00013307 [Ensete ventricosum]